MTHQHLSNITYKVLTPNMVPKVVDCVVKSFSNDPFTQLLKLNQQNWIQMSHMFIDRAAQKDYSLVAINNQDQQVIGCILLEDWKERQPPTFHTGLDEVWNPVKSIFAQLHQEYKQQHVNNIKFGEVIHALYFTCVTPQNRGKGVAYDMWYHSTDIARAYNFQYMVGETSTRSGERLCEHIGFTQKAAIPYNKFKYDGERIFSKLPHINTDFEKLTMWEKKIVSNLY
ncbi:hypothetical protein DICPUDRAFT_31630 [Dictyostelium purpureum]|uniref:N-acetyltransferase domain-containing protein n=1 Tax=Dictyostelium purpureum TaxID=5786 RepID=F0ZHI2_DICPU|nr:uncharacterized protein DICPUDRAFT_31630 [Dictyostelium purpureum]EGC36571.1 hypothetical protein DICPUDRAFT_31630 [Dictyostelium purpureum]|eukprot:XP_003286875.1 hypothetical protein DICPUDRAFT_31630 [Dictyostelium purpureum]